MGRKEKRIQKQFEKEPIKALNEIQTKYYPQLMQDFGRTDDFRVIEDKEHHLVVSFLPSNITTAQLVGIIGKSYEINDFTIKAPDIEDMVRGIYERDEIAEDSC